MKKYVINVEHQIGDLLYVIHDPEQKLRMVTRYLVNDVVMYELSTGDDTNYFHAYELSISKDYNLS